MAVTFLGDVFLPEAYRATGLAPGPFVPNLEHPITTSERGAPGKVNLKAEHSHLRETFGRLPAAVCLANNHVMDYGAEGFADTLAVLAAEGVPHFGAGPLVEDCGNPLVLDVDGTRLGLMGYVCPTASPVFATPSSPGVLPIDLATIRRHLREAREAGAERLIVALHWGQEEVGLPRPPDVALARAIAAAGADLVVGHHAHCAQPMETAGGVPIFYGLGNAVMPDLDVPSRFVDGAATRRYRKKQRAWNRRGLAIDYDPRTGEARSQAIRFDGRDAVRLPSGGARPLRHHPRRYPARYRLRALRDLGRHAALDYAARPRLPTLGGVRDMVRLLRPGGGG